MASIINVPGISKTSDWFRWYLVRIGAELRIDPDYIATIISQESGFNPAATNPYTKATGLIQFMPDTAKRLYTSVDQLRQMTAEAQLQYVKSFYSRFAGRIRSVGDLYMATFRPDLVGKPGSTPIYTEGQTGYTQNAGLDLDKDGVIRVSDVTTSANNRYIAGMARARIEVPDKEPPRPAAKGGFPWRWLAVLGGAGAVAYYYLK
jgi:hypothetical protein